MHEAYERGFKVGKGKLRLWAGSLVPHPETNPKPWGFEWGTFGPCAHVMIGKRSYYMHVLWLRLR